MLAIVAGMQTNDYGQTYNYHLADFISAISRYRLTSIIKDITGKPNLVGTIVAKLTCCVSLCTH